MSDRVSRTGDIGRSATTVAQSPGPAPSRRPLHTTCGVSVVIPTHAGRLLFLLRLLSSLTAAAGQAGEPVEVIVVDDSPEADDVAVACREHGALYLRGPRRGGAKRNVGVAAAQYDVVLFIDSDCVAHQSLISAHLSILREEGPDVAGVVGFSRFVGSGGWIWRLAGRSGRYNSCFDWPLSYWQVLWGATANLSVRRDAFLAVGGFDEETWTVVGGEDGALCTSMVDGGYRIRTGPTAVVLHGRDHMTSLRSLVRSMIRYGAADAYLCHRFPHRTRRVATPVVVLGAAGLLGATARIVLGRRILALSLFGGLALLATRDFRAQRERSARVTALRASCGVGDGFDEDIERAASAPLHSPPGATNPAVAVGAGIPPWTDAALDLICVLFDWTFDIGAAVSALRRGRFDLLHRRFDYMDRREFIARETEGP